MPFWVLEVARGDGVTVYPGYPCIPGMYTCVSVSTPQNGAPILGLQDGTSDHGPGIPPDGVILRGAMALRFYGYRFDAVFGGFCTSRGGEMARQDSTSYLAHQIARWIQAHRQMCTSDPAFQITHQNQYISPSIIPIPIIVRARVQ